MKVTIIGVGGLGGALARGLLDAPGVSLTLCARRPALVASFAGRASIVDDAQAAVRHADVVVLAVKPKGTPELFASIAAHCSVDALVVSCAAGVPLARLSAAIEGASTSSGPSGHASRATSCATARAMPNIGAQVRASTTAVFLGAACDAERDRARLRAVFAPLGEVREVHDEGWLHAVTAVAASGPAFLLLAVEALVDAGVEQGLPRTEALAYARGALAAAAGRLVDGIEPSSLRAQVTSPAGTTAAGLARLEAAATRGAFLDAVRAATARSKEL